MTVASSVKDAVSAEQFKQIVDANLLTQRWYKSLDHNAKSLVEFVACITKNPESLLVHADCDTKNQFYSDIPKMLVPQQYEETIITNCRLMVCKIVNKYKFSNYDVIEDAIAVGNLAVRNAIWYFNRTDIAFTSFAYKAIKAKVSNFKSEVHKNKEFTSTEVNGDVLEFTDIFVDTKSFSPLLPSSRTNKLRAQGKQYALLDNCDRSFTMKHIINSACCSKADKELVYLFINNPDTWIDDFRKNNFNPHGKAYHTFSVRKRLHNVIKRMRDIADSEGITIDNIIADFGTGET